MEQININEAEEQLERTNIRHIHTAIYEDNELIYMDAENGDSIVLFRNSDTHEAVKGSGLSIVEYYNELAEDLLELDKTNFTTEHKAAMAYNLFPYN